ncbi:MAG: Mbeg1-like protein [Bifidobacteriaceae bacterium]|nr:Mbeg1-like protein [Bifidobacteriaceae bacterium]
MKTIVDYVLHTSASFNDKPFCDADAIALSQLSYFEMPPTVPRLDLSISPTRRRRIQETALWGSSNNNEQRFAERTFAAFGESGYPHLVAPDPAPRQPLSSRQMRRQQSIRKQSIPSQTFAPTSLSSSVAADQLSTSKFSKSQKPSESSAMPLASPLASSHLRAQLYPAYSEPVPISGLLRSDWYGPLTCDVPYAQENIDLVRAMGESPRFRSGRLANVVEPADPDEDERFSALTIDLGNGVLFISLRGTDSTLAGWHDDYRMAFLSPVPSQTTALSYLARVLENWQGTIILGGHSKGGNLAVYCAALCPPAIQDRIIAVYSLDGPGFNDDFIHSPGYERIHGRVHKIIPEFSVIGPLLSSTVPVTIVKSSASGVMQHYTATWLFADDYRLQTTDHVSPLSQYLTTTLNTWNKRFPAQKRKLFIDSFFNAIMQAGYTDLFAAVADLRTAIPRVYAQIRKLPADERGLMTKFLLGLANTALIRLPDLLKPEVSGNR